jgi:hypothetical protein
MRPLLSPAALSFEILDGCIFKSSDQFTRVEVFYVSCAS